MKKINIFMFVAFGAASVVMGQGSLTPPGAPAPTMKSLDELDTSISSVSNSVSKIKGDARTPLVAGENGVSISASGEIGITQSGSYYLTKNLTVSSGDGIYIATSGITLDLNGCTIRSTSATPNGSAIVVRGKNVSIYNGHIESGTTYSSGGSGDQYTGSGFSHGIYADSPNSTGIRIHDITISGVDQYGIYVESQESIVKSCLINVAGGFGIYAGNVSHCRAITCGDKAIAANTVSGCNGISTGSDGIFGFIIMNSYGVSHSSDEGIYAYNSVQNSYGISVDGDGIHCNGVVNNSCGQTSSTHQSSYGIHAAKNVQNSYGHSNGDDGIFCGRVVVNSYGYSRGDNGIFCSGVVANSYGESTAGDGIYAQRSVLNSYGLTTHSASVGIRAFIANGCTYLGGSLITHKYNMP